MNSKLVLRITCLLIFLFFIWLALATRHHKDWFHPVIAKYGGDVIWAGAFLFLLRIIFTNVSLWKLSIWCYVLGVLDEISQLIRTPFALRVRSTTLGKLIFGQGFLWSDILCYAIGTMLAWLLIYMIEHFIYPIKKDYYK